jgi:AbrB family looped-hinge helix DNA binding protein
MSHSLSSKGQVTIPVEIRESLGLSAGSRVIFELCEGGALLRKDPTSIPPVRQAYGTLKLDRSVDEVIAEMRGPGPEPDR